MDAHLNVLDHGFVRLVQTQGHARITVDAARCSYGSQGDDLGDKDRKLIRFLLSNGHTSPFRHLVFTFHIKMPLFTAMQWTKYQVGSTWCTMETVDGEPVQQVDLQYDTDKGCSWNQLSGRYKVMEPEFYVPEVARRNTGRQASEEVDDEELTAIMQEALDTSHRHAVARYKALLNYGVAKELARLVLPPSIYSECYWTVSLQAVLHFLEQRLAPEAQFEIRSYAQAVLDLIRPDLEAMGIQK